MVRSLTQWMDYVVAGKDGEVGNCKDFLVEEGQWMIRYLVVDPRRWLPGRKVILSPYQLEGMDAEGRRLSATLTTQEIENSPPLEEAGSLSRDYEEEWLKHYGLPRYWLEQEEKGGSGRLLSVKDITGYHIQAKDGEIGHLADLLAQAKTWKVYYAIIDTRNWLPGRQVCVLTDCIQWVDQDQDKIGIDLTKEAIRHSPHYLPYEPMTREYQLVLHDYYGWPKYWDKL